MDQNKDIQTEESGTQSTQLDTFTKQKIAKRIKLLESKKSTLYYRLQRVYNYGQHSEDEKSKSYFLVGLQTVDDTIKEFKEIIEELTSLQLDLDLNAKVSFQELNSADELYCFIKTTEQSLKKPVPIPINNQTPSEQHLNTSVKKKTTIKLPKLDLPTFDASVEKWPIFFQAYSHVYSHPDLSVSDKLRYLLGKLTGPALKLISGYQPTEENFEAIWKTLTDKYQDTRTMGAYYLNKIINFKTLNKESAEGLENYMQSVIASYEALKVLNIPDLSEFIILHIALTKLDTSTLRTFEISERSTQVPKLSSLINFVREQIKILSRSRKEVEKDNKSVKTFKKSYQSFVTATPNTVNKCPLHKTDSHNLVDCYAFKKFHINKKHSFITQNKICKSCLQIGHYVSKCPTNTVCDICKRTGHHTLLHLSSNTVSKSPNETTKHDIQEHNKSPINNESTTVHCYTTNKQRKQTVILSTASIYVFDRWGEPHWARALLDTASQADFITNTLADRLQLVRETAHSFVKGIGNIERTMHHQIRLSFASRFDLNTQYSASPFVIDAITEKLPSYETVLPYLEEFEDLPLAEECHQNYEHVDILLGAESYRNLLKHDHRESSQYPLTAIQTQLGYILMGSIPVISEHTLTSHVISVNDELRELGASLKQFWESEKIPNLSDINNHLPLISQTEDIYCEKHFLDNLKRNKEGRYIVALPFRTSLNSLGNSLEISKKRFFSLENKFKRDPILKREYNEVMKDYWEQGHMSLLGHPIDSYYLPHFPVVKMERATTKVRVVFDASQKSDRGRSLNDILYTGAKLQKDITEILIGFRLHAIAVTADIKQMYRQIKIRDKDRLAQKILWRSSPEQELQAWQLNTVTFGVTTAPFLALRVIQQLAFEYSKEFPLAAEVILRDFFVDDLVTSVSDLNSAVNLYEELMSIFKKGQFDLVKWSSNSTHLLNKIPLDIQHPETVEFDADSNQKILGLQWCSVTDNFSFQVQPVEKEATKRNILSTLAKIFDPLGFVAPVTIRLKLLIQNLWKNTLDWDELIPIEIESEWISIKRDLFLLNTIKIPRYLGIIQSCIVDVVGFSDATPRAYGAVIYMRIESSDQHSSTHLLCSKAKIAPMKEITIPRLELVAVTLMVKLLKFTTHCLSNRIQVRNIWAFSDSEVCLYWITNPNAKWPVFVSNRVKIINDSVQNIKWGHVKGKENPADLLSRGVQPKNLVSDSLWFSGPQWLTHNVTDWTEFHVQNSSSQETHELHVLLSTIEAKNSIQQLIERHSNYTRLLHVMIYVLKFCKRLPNKEKLFSVRNLQEATIYIIRYIQRKHFAKDIDDILNQKTCSKKIQQLKPFILNGVLRVGGRLMHSDFAYSEKHPILLPKNDIFVTMLIKYIHQQNFHAGLSLTLSKLKNQYWIIDGKRTVKKVLSQCNYCFRFQPHNINPIMGDLPVERLLNIKPFYTTMIDYAGPILMLMTRHRGQRTQKAYISVFVCMTTKAVHLELVSELTTAAFIAALKRFVARRGPCKKIFSDCGTNFKGASTQLKELYTFTNSAEHNASIENELEHNNIEWHFNPPRSPHFTGLAETNVKSMKRLLFKSMGEKVFTYEELNTLLVQIEALLNSRPLLDRGCDSSNFDPLTPAHFFLQGSSCHLSLDSVDSIPDNRLTHYQQVEKTIKIFWKRWKEEYIKELQTRYKWYTNCNNLQVGTLVLIKDINLPPLKWPLGRIEKVYKGADNIVRVVDIRTHTGSYKRAVVNVCPLPNQ